jgi:chaperonin GroES
MILQPLADQIIIRLPKQEEERQINGIILASTIQKERDTQGTVIAVGSGRLMDNGTRITPEVSVGDKVIFAKYAGTEIANGEERLLILKERDIMAIVKPEESGIRVVH